MALIWNDWNGLKSHTASKYKSPNMHKVDLQTPLNWNVHQHNHPTTDWY